MSIPYALGKKAFGYCDRCGFRAPYQELVPLVIKTKVVNIKVCKECWEADQPQLQLGMYPVIDPQALYDPRPNQNMAQSRSTFGWRPVASQSASLTLNSVAVKIGDQYGEEAPEFWEQQQSRDAGHDVGGFSEGESPGQEAGEKEQNVDW